MDAVTLGSPDGRESLRLSWDADDAPYLGFWLNCRAWSGLRFGTLPESRDRAATAPHDDLADALRDGTDGICNREKPDMGASGGHDLAVFLLTGSAPGDFTVHRITRKTVKAIQEHARWRGPGPR